MKKKNKFNVGDIITGTEESTDRYMVTDENALMEVVKVFDEDLIEVEILDHKSLCGFKGYTYRVDPKFFKPFTKTEFKNKAKVKKEDRESDFSGLSKFLGDAIRAIFKSQDELKESVKKRHKRNEATITFDKYVELSKEVSDKIGEQMDLSVSDKFLIAKVFTELDTKLFNDDLED